MVGLNLAGVFEIGGRLAGIGQGLAARGGTTGAFFTGVLAVLVATPCTAPFMAAALGFALSQPAPQTVAVLLAMGLGLALPYLALSMTPALQRLMPRPGAWMDRLRQFLAFPMCASAAWMIWVLTQQTGADGVIYALGGMILIAFAIWLCGWAAPGRSARGCGRGLAAAAVLLAFAAVLKLRGRPRHGGFRVRRPVRGVQLRRLGALLARAHGRGGAPPASRCSSTSPPPGASPAWSTSGWRSKRPAPAARSNRAGR